MSEVIPEVFRKSTFISLSAEEIRKLLDLKMSVPKMAMYFGVSIKTVRRRMADYGIKVRDTYANLTDAELDHIVAGVALENPNLGIRLIKGMLWSDKRIRVPEQRLRECLRRVDPQGTLARLKANRAVNRRQYFVPTANFLWHVDTYCKGNRFNFIVRGAIDGKSRLCLYLHVGTNNKAITSLESFMEGVRSYGVPLHCRSDKGSETVLISRFMLMARGENGHWTGKSTRNQRIERFWGDCKRIASHFYDTMRELEDEGLLDIDNIRHMNILHWVYIPRFNQALEKFRNAWNHHPLSTEGYNTPNQLFLIHSDRSGGHRVYTQDELEALRQAVMVFAPQEEPEDSVRNLRDLNYVLTSDDEEALSAVDVLRESHVNGKDVYFECLIKVGEI